MPFCRALPLFLLLLILAVGVGAAPRPVKPAAFTPGSLTGIRETTLPNGLKVLTREVHAAPVVYFSVWYHVGSRNEHNGITGVSHILEHMMFKGTKRYAAGEIARTLFINGAEFNAMTSFDYTAYFETLSSDRLETAMQIESDRMVNSRIAKSDLDSEMTVVRSELEGDENNPGFILNENVEATAYQAHPYHWPTIGWRSDVENVPRDAIYRYYKSHYGPNNAAVVIVGDINTEKALQLVRTYFGGLPRIPTPAPVYTKEPPQRGERRIAIRRAGSLPIVEIAYKNPPSIHPDNYALDMLGTILGSGESSRLYQALVVKQLASSVSANNEDLRDPYLFDLSATAGPGVPPDEVEKALLAEVARVQEAQVTDAELERARNQIIASYVFQNDSVSEQGGAIGQAEMTTGWRYLAGYLDKIRAVTAADVQSVAQKYLVRDAQTIGQFLPSSQGGPEAPPARENSARVEKPQPGQRPIPLPKPAPESHAKRNVTRFQLGNGISVVVSENPSNPTFALRVSLPAGSVLEPKSKDNLAAITAAMLTRGTEKHSALDIAQSLDSVGASLSASADELTTSVVGQGQTKDFDLVMDSLAEILLQPSFPATELEQIRAQIQSGLQSAKDDPGALASRAFERAVYPEGSPLRPLTLAESESALTGITRDDVASFYRQQYGPDHMIVVVAGDVKVDRVRQALESRLGSWPRNPAADALPTLDVPLQQKPLREVIQVPDRSQVEIVWGEAGLLKRSDPDFYSTQIMNTILGGGTGLSSRLATAIRDQRGLVYTVFSSFDPGLYAGPFQVEMGTNPVNVQRAVSQLDVEIRRLLKGGVTQREVDEAVSFLTGSFPVRLETNAGLASTLWAMEFYHLGPDYPDRYAGYYRAVTVASANAAARKHLHPDQATLVIAGTVGMGAGGVRRDVGGGK